MDEAEDLGVWAVRQNGLEAVLIVYIVLFILNRRDVKDVNEDLKVCTQ